MIIESFVTIQLGIFSYLINLLPELPSVPNSIQSDINSVLDIIFSNLSLFDLFIPLNLVIILLPLVIVISNFNRIWGVIEWIWRHIPIVGAS